MKRRRERSSRAEALVAVGAVALTTFAGVAVASASRASSHIDRTLSPRLAPRPRSRSRRVAEALSPVGKWYTVVPAALVGGALLARDRKRRIAGGTIAASSVAAFAFSKAFDRLLPQPPVPPNHRHEPNKPAFPSGHAMLATAVAPTAAYVLGREELVPPRIAAAAAIAFSVSQPALKLAVRKHWASDVVGGWAAGATIAALCCAAYESLSS
jgi:membrane-associated phospholipid phosphatase